MTYLNNRLHKILSKNGYNLSVKDNHIKVTRKRLSEFLPLLIFPFLIFGSIMGVNSEGGSVELVMFESFWTGVIDAFVIFAFLIQVIIFIKVIINIYRAFVFKVEVRDNLLIVRKNGFSNKIPLSKIQRLDTRKHKEDEFYDATLYVVTEDRLRIDIFKFGPSKEDPSGSLTEWKKYLEKVIPSVTSS